MLLLLLQAGLRKLKGALARWMLWVLLEDELKRPGQALMER